MKLYNFLSDFFTKVFTPIKNPEKYNFEPIKWHGLHFLLSFSMSVIAVVLIKESDYQGTFYYWAVGIYTTLLFFYLEAGQLPKHDDPLWGESFRDGITDLNQYMGCWLPVIYKTIGLGWSAVAFVLILIIYIATFKWTKP